MKWAAPLFLSFTLVAACQSAPATSAPATSAARSGPPPASGLLPSDTGATGSLPPRIAGGVGPGDFVLADPLTGLGDLTSYRATLRVSFDGTAGGRPKSWSMTTVLAADSPTSGVLTTESTGDIDPQLLAGRSAWSAARDGAVYARDAGGGCTASTRGAAPSGATTGLPLEQPAAALTALLGAESAGRETIGAIEADSFTFDQLALGFRSTAQAAGRVSLATQGGYIVRYDVTTTGGPDYFGESVSGTLGTAYELSDVGGAVAVDLPTDCPPGLIAQALLLPADASDQIARPAFRGYTVAASLAATVDQVRGSAVLAHWKQAAEPRIGKTYAHLSYTDGDLHLDVFIRRVDGKSVVEILGSWD